MDIPKVILRNEDLITINANVHKKGFLHWERSKIKEFYLLNEIRVTYIGHFIE